MAYHRTVSEWIISVPDAKTTKASLDRPTKKRKLSRSPTNQKKQTSAFRIRRYPSPPDSNRHHSPPFPMSSSAKHTRTPTRKPHKRSHEAITSDKDDQDELADIENTPRGNARQSEIRKRALPSSRSKTSTTSGTRSGASSPVKRQMMQLSLDRTATFGPLSVEDPPNDAAGDLLERIAVIRNGCGIMPLGQRDEILNHSLLQGGRLRMWKLAFDNARNDQTDSRNLSGRIPSIQEVVSAWKRAKKCHSMQHEEAAWNCEVHHYLLSIIFRKPDLVEAVDGIDLTYCTTARPDSRWLPTGTHTKMVDFCLYSTSLGDHKKSIRDICNALGTLTINHITFSPLQFQPIMLSIETKKPDMEIGKAQLQMVIWHSAQWGFLKEAIRAAYHLRRGEAKDLPLSMEEEYSEEAEAERYIHHALKELPFLPGVIVHGHRWLLVMSTWDGDGVEDDKGQGGKGAGNFHRVKFWGESQFGSTDDLLELYKVVAGLREIAYWTDSVYLPWFKYYILGVPIEKV